MQLSGKCSQLFQAFSFVNKKAFEKKCLLSNPTLSKAPNYGDVLERYIKEETCKGTDSKKILLTCFKYVLANFGHFFFLVYAKIVISILRWKSPLDDIEENKRLVVIDSFAVLPKIVASKKIEELYLPDLADFACSSGNACVQYYKLYGSRSPFVLWKAFCIMKKQGGCITEVHLLRGIDWLKLFFHIISYPFYLMWLIRYVKKIQSDKVYSYIHQALIDTAGQCILPGEVARLAGKRLGDEINRLTSDKEHLLASWYENQTINKTFYYGIRQSKVKIKIIGAQLLIWPEALLNNHPDDYEDSMGLAPDKVLVNGRFFLPEKSIQQYNVGPSLRYKNIFVDPDLYSNKKEKNLLVLLSYHPEETIRVLSLVKNLQGYSIYYKFHPATTISDFKEWLPSNPELVFGGLYEALANSGAVIGSGSGALAEAAALGLPVLQVWDKHGLTLNYLPPFGENLLWMKVGKAEEVENALEKLQKSSELHVFPALVETMRALLFTKPDKNKILEGFELY